MTNHLRLPLFLLMTCGWASAPAADDAPPRYQQQPGSSLTFTFTQLGAATEGRFRSFDTVLNYDESNLAASTLRVTVRIDSLDTQDGERDGLLLTPELFDAGKHPTATYFAGSLVRGPEGLEAVGKLTLRGVTRELRLPLTIKATPAGLELTGQIAFRRLDYGVGQGEWRSTESVGDEVRIRYQVTLAKAR